MSPIEVRFDEFGDGIVAHTCSGEVVLPKCLVDLDDGDVVFPMIKAVTMPSKVSFNTI